LIDLSCSYFEKEAQVKQPELKQLYDIAIDHSRVTKRTHHHGNENDPAITRLATPWHTKCDFEALSQ
jgi:hypothetical protein